MATTKLTDAQRVILVAAGARESGLVLPLPDSLGINRGTLGVVLKSLLTRGLITERAVLAGEEVWRETEEMGRTTLVISVNGLQLMGIEPTGHGAMIAALLKPEGATIPELMQATGWQAHSVRGAMSGNLKKKLNLDVISEVIENGGRVYRIAADGSAE